MPYASFTVAPTFRLPFLWWVTFQYFMIFLLSFSFIYSSNCWILKLKFYIRCLLEWFLYPEVKARWNSKTLYFSYTLGLYYHLYATKVFTNYLCYFCQPFTYCFSAFQITYSLILKNFPCFIFVSEKHFHCSCWLFYFIAFIVDITLVYWSIFVLYFNRSAFFLLYLTAYIYL